MEEMIDVLNEKTGSFTGETILKAEAHKTGKWHGSIHIVIVNKEGTKTLLQKRCNQKELYPNMWDIAVGGHISAGETALESAKRELKEELGLEFNTFDVKQIDRIKEQITINGIINNEYATIYLLRGDVDISKIRLQEEEVSDVKWCSLEELNQLISSNQIVPHAREYELLNELLSSNLLIQELITKLELGTLIGKPERVMGGLLNRMYKVNTSQGTYAIKHLNPEVMKRENAKENHILAEKIANIAKENDINCLPAKIIKGNTLQEIEGNYFFIFDWFEGKAIDEDKINLEHVQKVATLLAKIHNINFNEVKKECKLGNEISEVDWDFYISRLENIEIKDLLINKKDYLIDLDKKATNARKEISNNLVVSHRDLDLPNILWNIDNIPTIIDWESSGLVNPCEELLETAWDWSGGQEYFDEKKFTCFINTYKNSGGNLSDFDKAIYSNFKNKSGWLEYNLKRVCKLECLDEEEQILGESEVIRVINEISVFYETMKKINI